MVVKTDIHTWSKHWQQVTVECLDLNGTSIASMNILEEEAERIEEPEAWKECCALDMTMETLN